MSRERDESFDEIGKKIKREIDAASFPSQTLLGTAGGSGRRQQQQPMFGAAGGLAVAAAGGGSILNTITPCAACKLLRRRCAQECPFSPYFSPHEPQKFASVHKVFGASNVSKMLMEVPENQRADAANSLVYEANVRLRDPVYGCMGAISALQQQIQVLQAELTAVRADILNYKFRRENTMIPSSHDSHVSLFNSGAISMAAEPPLPQPPSTPLPSQQQQVSPPSPTPGPPPTIPSSSSASSIYSSQDASPRTHHRQHHDCDTISNHDHNLSFFG